MSCSRRLATAGVLWALSAVTLSGCGESGPLSGTERTASKDNGGVATQATPAPTPVDPAVRDYPIDQTKPGPMPDDLATAIREALDLFSQDKLTEAFTVLVESGGAGNENPPPEKIAETLPKIIRMLLEGALKKSLETQPRLTESGTFALFVLSDTTHVKFNKVDGKWRLANGNRPNPMNPGVSYNNAPPHAAFLLERLEGVKAVAGDAPWPESERETVAALLAEGAGLAIGKSAGGDAVSAAVLNREFRGNDATIDRLKSLGSLRILAIYESPLSPAALLRIPEMTNLTHLRILRDSIPGDLTTAAGRVEKLRSLSLTALQRGASVITPIGGLKSLESCELVNLAFDRNELSDLKELPRLTRLDLSLSTVDDKSLEIIAEYPALTSVKIPTTETTADGLAALRSRVPNLFVDW